MITIKYNHPVTKVEVIEELDPSIDVSAYITNLHTNFLCKDVCNGENCKVYMLRNDVWTLLGVQD